MSEIKQQVLEELCSFLTGMETELEDCNRQELRKRRLTSHIIKGTLTLMLILLIANSYYLYQLSTGLNDSLHMVDRMATQFGRVTGSLSQVTDSVDSINVRFQALDDIDVDMVTVNAGIATISDSLAGISGTVIGLSGELYLVDRSMGVMDGQVYGMTGNVQQMGNSVRKMAGPMSFFNSMMPW